MRKKFYLQFPKTIFSLIKIISRLFIGLINWRVLRFPLLIIISIYLLAGIGFAIPIYKYHARNKAANWAVKIYPYPAARVDGSILYLKTVYERGGFLEYFSEKAKQTTDSAKIRETVFDEAVTTQIIKIQARKNWIRVKKNELDEAFNKVAEANDNAEKVREVLRDLYGMSEKDFRVILKEQLLEEKVRQNILVNIHARHILIKDEKTARDVLERIKKGEDFNALAKQYSEDSNNRDKGGDLEWFSRGQMVKEFEEAVFKAEKGSVIPDLVKTQYGFHIVKVEDKKGKIDKNYDEWLAELKKKTKVWKFYK